MVDEKAIQRSIQYVKNIVSEIENSNGRIDPIGYMALLNEIVRIINQVGEDKVGGDSDLLDFILAHTKLMKRND